MGGPGMGVPPGIGGGAPYGKSGYPPIGGAGVGGEAHLLPTISAMVADHSRTGPLGGVPPPGGMPWAGAGAGIGGPGMGIGAGAGIGPGGVGGGIGGGTWESSSPLLLTDDL